MYCSNYPSSVEFRFSAVRKRYGSIGWLARAADDVTAGRAYKIILKAKHNTILLPDYTISTYIWYPSFIYTALYGRSPVTRQDRPDTTLVRI